MSKPRTESLHAARVLGLALAVSAFAADATRADVIVIGSDSPAIKAGAVLADAATLDVPSGASVTIMLPSGRTERLKGPLTRAVAELAKGEKSEPGLWDSVQRYVQKQGKPSEGHVGAVRSLAPKPAKAPLPFSWRQVPVDSDGDVCVEKGVPIELARPGGGKSTRLTVVDMQAQKRADTTFAEGASSAPWPKEIEPKVGTYSLVVEGAPMRELRLRLVSPLPAPDETLRVLHGQRCQRQIEAWLRAVMTAAK